MRFLVDSGLIQNSHNEHEFRSITAIVMILLFIFIIFYFFLFIHSFVHSSHDLKNESTN